MHGRVHVHWHAHTVLLGGPFLAVFFAPFLAGASFLPNCAGQAWAWDMSHGALELCVLAWEWSKEYFTGAHGDGPGARGGHAGVNNRGARRGVGERASQREAWSKAAWSKPVRRSGHGDTEEEPSVVHLRDARGRAMRMHAGGGLGVAARVSQRCSSHLLRAAHQHERGHVGGGDSAAQDRGARDRLKAGGARKADQEDEGAEHDLRLGMRKCSEVSWLPGIFGSQATSLYSTPPWPSTTARGSLPFLSRAVRSRPVRVEALLTFVNFKIYYARRLHYPPTRRGARRATPSKFTESRRVGVFGQWRT